MASLACANESIWTFGFLGACAVLGDSKVVAGRDWGGDAGVVTMLSVGLAMRGENLRGVRVEDSATLLLRSGVLTLYAIGLKMGSGWSSRSSVLQELSDSGAHWLGVRLYTLLDRRVEF